MKLTKKAQLLLVATVLPLLLAGCTVQYNENHEPIGWLYNYLVGTFAVLALRWRLNILSLPDQEAQSLGVNVNRERLVIIGISTLLTAAAVCLSKPMIAAIKPETIMPHNTKTILD
mgnify:CR=1 FL=1